MLGFVRPAAGSVICNQQLLRNDNDALAAWRRQVSLVSQDSLVFKRSIRENLCYGAPGATEEELQAAMEKTCLKDWIESLENGIDTVLQGREKQLSGGQRQRLQLCRLFLQDKPIFFMVSDLET